MIEVLNLLPVLAVAMILNIACGTWYNIKFTDITFDKAKFLDGIKKAVIIGVSLVGLAYIVSEVPSVTDAIGIAPIGIITLAIIAYTVKFVGNLAKILGVNIKRA